MFSVQKLIIALYVLITSIGLVILKYGSNNENTPSILSNKLPINLNAYTIFGILLYGISFLLYIYLLSRYDLGYIIPLAASFVYILIFMASFFVFKEAFTATKIIAIFLILSGIIILNIGNK